jgi:hypothetical protein
VAAAAALQDPSPSAAAAGSTVNQPDRPSNQATCVSDVPPPAAVASAAALHDPYPRPAAAAGSAPNQDDHHSYWCQNYGCSFIPFAPIHQQAEIVARHARVCRFGMPPQGMFRRAGEEDEEETAAGEEEGDDDDAQEDAEDEDAEEEEEEEDAEEED